VNCRLRIIEKAFFHNDSHIRTHCNKYKIMTQKYLNELTNKIPGAAVEVHNEPGQGLPESIYQRCLIHLLKKKGLKIITQQKVPILIKGIYLDCDLRIDLMVEDSVIVEIKAIK